MVTILISLMALNSQAAVVHYTLDNVVLDDNNSQMFGEFSWTYDEGDFENGVGQFSYLEIPFTIHDHTDLNATFDIGSSIEITLEGNIHDDGVDITLRLLSQLGPTSGAAIDLEESAFDIGGNGFHAGLFLSGSVILSNVAGMENQNDSPSAMTSTLTTYPNPFNPRTRLVFELDHESTVNLEIFDIQGHNLGTITQGVYSQGVHSVMWNGTNSHGQSVPSGRYFARLKTDNALVTHSMTLVR